jgi:hypothetical protein
MRNTAEHRVGTLVDRDTADLADAELAADPRRRLHHDDVCGVAQCVGGGQPGHPTTDDRNRRSGCGHAFEPRS